MSHSSSGFVIPIIDSEPKACLVSINTSVPIASGNKRANDGKNDVLRNVLVSHCDSAEYGVEANEYETMVESEEAAHLLCGKSVYQAIKSNKVCRETSKDAESLNDNFKFYTIDPVCMNVRLCIFWFLWAMLIAVLILSILSYCCFTPKMCANSKETISVNTTAI